jgi:hypothetical protein
MNKVKSISAYPGDWQVDRLGIDNKLGLSVLHPVAAA